MKRTSQWFPLLVLGLLLVIFVLAIWKFGFFIWLDTAKANLLLDGIYKSLLILAVVSGAVLAYVRFFAYGFVFYLADSDVSVDVMPHSNDSNLHFITLKAANRGTFRLHIKDVTWEVTDFPKALTQDNENGKMPASDDVGGRIIQVIDRGETISLLVACREVSADSVASSAYHITMHASGRTWYSSCAVSNRLPALRQQSRET